MKVALLFAVVTGLAAEGFQPVAEDHGVKVYRRDSARGIELAAEGEIAAPPDRVRAVLLDYAGSPRRVHNLVESRVLRAGADWLDVYQRLDLPVLDDRDYTLHVTWGDDHGALWTHYVAANERGPEAARGVVRITLHEGGWRLEPLRGGMATWAVYRTHIDIAGSLPSWLGRGRAAKDVPALFDGIRAEATRH